jgi:hypothetical protein
MSIRFYTGLRGLMFELSLPLKRDSSQQARLMISLGFVLIMVYFNWKGTADGIGMDEKPVYGFRFFDDLLFLQWGQNLNSGFKRNKTIRMPWAWNHIETVELNGSFTYYYTYKLDDGGVQKCLATCRSERTLLKRNWIPYRKVIRTIQVDFDKPIGPGVETWKGGTVGCMEYMKPGESPIQTLMRMQRERRFN